MRRRLGRVVGVALSLAALVLPTSAGGIVQPALAQIPPVRIYLGEEYGLGVTGGGRFCVGESVQFTVRVVRYGVYQDEGGQVNVPRSAPYRLLRTGVPGSAGVTFQASNRSVLGPLLSSSYTIGAALEVVVTTDAAQVGTTTVRFRVESPGVDPAEATVDVEVTNCDYEVHTASLWHITAGRNDVGVSTVDTVIRSQGTGHLIITLVSPDAMSENLVIQFPRGECESFTRTISTSPAPVTGYLDLGDNTLLVKISYGPVTAATEETCHTPVGDASGGSDGPGTPDLISFDMDPGGGDDSADHILRIPGLGDFTGMVFITVTPIHL